MVDDPGLSGVTAAVTEAGLGAALKEIAAASLATTVSWNNFRCSLFLLLCRALAFFIFFILSFRILSSCSFVSV
jgi:hypothetical protein